MASPRLTGRALHESEGLFTLKMKPGPGFCWVHGCRKGVKPTHATLGLCHGHFQARWRMKSKKKSAYATLRDHAKARGIPFTIELPYFLGLTDAYAFYDHSAESRGMTPSLDRIDSSRGYEAGNLRVILQSENAAREGRERHLPEDVKRYLATKRARAREAMADVDRKTAVESYEERLARTGDPF